jgi:hypothetical protein
MIASSTIPLELCDEYSTPFDSQDLQKVQEILCEETVNDEDEDSVISEKAARAIKGEAEFAFVREELISTEEIKPVICDGSATSMLSSSFENCTDCQPKTVEIKTAERGVVMTTTHVCMKTYYVKSRTVEIRSLTTKPFIVPSLRTDLISVKSLNRQGYRVIHDPDPEESGIYPVMIFDGKIDKSKSFAFMSGHSIFLLSKQNLCQSNNCARSRVMRSGTRGWAILPREISMILFHLSRDWKKLTTSPTINIQNVHPA